MILRAMPAVTQILVGSLMSDRAKVMIQIERDTLAVQVGGWDMIDNSTP
jgi:hypothetical protein